MQVNCEYEPAIKIVKKGTGKPGAHRYADGIRCLLNWIGGRQSPGIRRQVGRNRVQKVVGAENRKRIALWR